MCVSGISTKAFECRTRKLPFSVIFMVQNCQVKSTKPRNVLQYGAKDSLVASPPPRVSTGGAGVEFEPALHAEQITHLNGLAVLVPFHVGRRVVEHALEDGVLLAAHLQLLVQFLREEVLCRRLCNAWRRNSVGTKLRQT